jgi:hypothetical protein
MTIGKTGIAMVFINNLILTLIRQANFLKAAKTHRWFTANLTFLTTPLCYFEKVLDFDYLLVDSIL